MPPFRMLILMTCVCAIGVRAAGQSAPTSAPSQVPKPSAQALPPPEPILSLLHSTDIETQLDGFQQWHAWRISLATSDRAKANQFLATEDWLEMLGNVTVYDVLEPKHRIAAYRLLERLGGQQVFPYFLWGVDPMAQEGIAFFLTRNVVPAHCVKDFFEKHGDPTVIEFLPEYIWWDVRRKIQERWQNRDAPSRGWTPIDPEQFFGDLAHGDVKRRALAIRALACNRSLPSERLCTEFRQALVDPAAEVADAAVQVLSVVSCPDARGRLKMMAADAGRSLISRRGCLSALANCHAAESWTAEWIVASLPGWPAELDEAAADCLERMRPAAPTDAERYVQSLRRLATNADERTRAVLDSAIHSRH